MAELADSRPLVGIGSIYKLGADASAEFGAKAFNLGVLHQQGFPVPPGVVLGRSLFSRYLELAGIDLSILESLDAVGLSDLEETIKQLDQQRIEILERLATVPIQSELADSILTPLANELEISEGIAVRSSSTAEDLPQASFAGQYVSILDARSEEEVLDAIRACWASQYEGRVLDYAVSRRGVPVIRPSMGVILQKMVPADFAGVCFTKGPTAKTANHVIIEAVEGLGESLVSGVRTPWHFEFDRGGKLRRRIAPAQLMSSPELADLVHLANLCRKIEEVFDSPQDIEWAIVNRSTFILQARPITASQVAPAPLPAMTVSSAAETSSDVSRIEVPSLLEILDFDLSLVRGASHIIATQSENGAWEVHGEPQWNEVATARIYRLLTVGGIPPEMSWEIPMTDGGWRRGGLDRAFEYLLSRFSVQELPGQDLWDTCNIMRAVLANPSDRGRRAVERPLSVIGTEVSAGFRGMDEAEWYGPGFAAAALELFLDLQDQESAGRCAEQLMDGYRDDGAFEVHKNASQKGVPPEWHTSQAISALARARLDGLTLDGRIGEAIVGGGTWLVRRQNEDGSWGPANNRYSSFNVYFTSYALMALIAAGQSAPDAVAIGERWLRSRQHHSGAFGDIASSLMAMEYLQSKYGPLFRVQVPIPLLNKMIAVLNLQSRKE